MNCDWNKMQALRDYEVLLGTYEEFVIGYKLNDSRKDPKFEASFADHSHAGSGNYLQFFNFYKNFRVSI